MRLELVEMKQDGRKYFAARAIPAGLTAYGDTKDHAVKRLKQMFAFWVDTRFRLMSKEVDNG